ncbi:hypothetical protein EBT25_11065 [bacterium]|nr:hypothetical protein [bacterium]
MHFIKMERVTLEDIIQCKQQNAETLRRDLGAIRARKVYGGLKVLWHFQVAAILRTRVIGNRPTLAEVLTDEKSYQALMANVQRIPRPSTLPARVLEMFRFNQAVTFFRPSEAFRLYDLFKPSHVLDPTAGWGGRMLAAHAYGISYTGIDTNVSLQPGYEGMMALLGNEKMRMIWENTLKVDYEAIDYDFVLTSTPYVDKKGRQIERYEHMQMPEDFYGAFLVPLIQKCLYHIRRKGCVCFEMSALMYEEVSQRFRPADEQHEGKTVFLIQTRRPESRSHYYVWYS